LSMSFSSSIDMIVVFVLYSVKYYVYWFAYVVPSLHP
jgi:hypothetical protein